MKEFGFQGFVVVLLLMVAAIVALTCGLKYLEDARKRKNDVDDTWWGWGMT